MRTVTVDGEIWRWKCGTNYANLVSPQGKRFNFPASQVAGVTPDVWERGHWKRTFDGMLTPRQVVHFIKGHLPFAKPHGH